MTVTIDTGGDPGFPADYRPDRLPPGALLEGDDWQELNASSDLYTGYGFYHINGNSVAATKMVELEANDPTFGKVAKGYQGDGSTRRPGATAAAITLSRGVDFAGSNRVWYRFTVKFQKGFTTKGQGGGASAWKFLWTSPDRGLEFSNTDQYIQDFNHQGWSGSESPLPGNNQPNKYRVTTEWTDEEWWEYIFFAERVNGSHYRMRRWRRELTRNGVIVGPTSTATWSHRFGAQITGSSIPNRPFGGITMGKNRNKAYYAGQWVHFFYGPWEAIDADVMPNPYGIEDQIK